MVTVGLVRDLFAHMEWADARMWAAMPDTSPPDEVLRRTMFHIHVVQRAFLQAWTGSFGAPLPTADDFASLAEVRGWAEPYYGQARAAIDTFTDEQLARPVVLPWSAQVATMLGHEPGTTTWGETCLQVASHTTHHRGQANMRLRAIGSEPPYVDYIVWLWQRRPAPLWQ